MSQPNLEAKILNQLRAIFANYPAIERVELYGSRAKGTEHPRSDIDLVAYGAKIDRFIVSQLLLDLDDSEITLQRRSAKLPRVTQSFIAATYQAGRARNLQ